MKAYKVTQYETGDEYFTTSLDKAKGKFAEIKENIISELTATEIDYIYSMLSAEARKKADGIIKDYVQTYINDNLTTETESVFSIDGVDCVDITEIEIDESIETTWGFNVEFYQLGESITKLLTVNAAATEKEDVVWTQAVELALECARANNLCFTGLQLMFC